MWYHVVGNTDLEASERDVFEQVDELETGTRIGAGQRAVRGAQVITEVARGRAFSGGNRTARVNYRARFPSSDGPLAQSG